MSLPASSALYVTPDVDRFFLVAIGHQFVEGDLVVLSITGDEHPPTRLLTSNRRIADIQAPEPLTSKRRATRPLVESSPPPGFDVGELSPARI